MAIFNIPPLSSKMMKLHWACFLNFQKDLCIELLLVFVICCSTEMYLTSSSLLWTFSLMKCTFIFICLVLTWNTRFDTNDPTLTLSHQRTEHWVNYIPSSLDNCCSQIISIEAWVKYQSLDFVLEQATIFCFLQLHWIMLFPK